MAIDDRTGRDLDHELEGVVVVFNASDEPTSQTVAALSARRYKLHPVEARGGDPIVRASTYRAATGTFTVPARTVAVFVTHKNGAVGAGPSAGTPPGSRPSRGC